MRMTVGSTCSGYGGLEMGVALWQRQEIDVRWHAEIDPDASLVLKTWWPEVPNLGDFTAPDFTAEWVDLECAGVPCQPFSAAGLQRGAADPRHLWPDWRRGIAARLPETVVFENVAGLTQGKKRPVFLAIIQDLLDLGYDVRWCLLGACAVGAAHHRHRVFLLARRTRTAPTACEVTVQTCGQSVAAYLPTPRTADGVTRGHGSPDYWATHGEGRMRLSEAIPLLPTPRAIDAARGPVTAERTEMSGRKNGVELASTLNMLPTPKRQDGNNGANHRNNRGEPGGIAAVNFIDWGKYAEAIARHEAMLGRPAPEPTEIGPKGGRRLTAAFSEWLMMLPEGHLTSVLSRNPALARAGNGVMPLQAATALALLDADLQSY